MPEFPLPTVPVPVPHAELARYVAENPHRSVVDLFRPYRQFEAQLRQIYAQDHDNEILKDDHINVLPLFGDGQKADIKIRARNLDQETQAEKERYVMPLPDDQRRPEGSPAVVQSLKEFRHNFNVFSESALVDLDWSNLVASGSSVVNTVLPIPGQYRASKRALREFYHEKFCPASDVDLFIYGLTEEQAIEKIRQVEERIRDSILTETTTVRTKNAITICSQYPTRHIQIVLRIYKNVSEILTGFDIDCSGAAYDGKQVYCTPRALQSYITQINHIDLSRRSPSYENRLSKYSHRGFEVYWPELDRSRVDPTIFERSFQRTLGLARLLVLERLPTASSRDSYLAKRRQERGRPPLNRRHFRRLAGNIKENHEDEVAEWVNEDDVSNYHTFTVPYGVKFHAKKIEKLCYTRDLLLNAEWNQPKDREVYLHRHPAFFGRFEDVVNDCCGFCPKPETDEEKTVHNEESKIYVSGRISFLQDNPGRQQIGSFNPLTEDDWTEMAYIGNTARLCQDIVDGELENVQDWLAQAGADPNTRDHTGRTPLHLAVTSSTAEVVQCLVDHGARLVARLADGRTALHLAAERGDTEIVQILMDKSNANEAAEEEKQSQQNSKVASTSPSKDDESTGEGGSDVELISDADSEGDDEKQSIATGSFVKVKKDIESPAPDGGVAEDKEDGPDFYDVNVIAWDSKCSAIHLAILCGHEQVVKLLCQEYGADILLPIKFLNEDKRPAAAILTLVLSVNLPIKKAKSMAKTILSLGASSAQADLNGSTALQRIVEENATELVEVLLDLDRIGVTNSINHIPFNSWQQTDSILQHAIRGGDVKLVLQLLDAGAVPQVDFETWLKSAKQIAWMEYQLRGSLEDNTKVFKRDTEQPIITAVQSKNPSIVVELLKRGADVNAMTKQSYSILLGSGMAYFTGQTVLDLFEDQLQQLRKYEPPVAKTPELNYGMEDVLERYKQGTWQYAAVHTAVYHAHGRNKRTLNDHENEKARILKLKGIDEKQAAIDAAVVELQEIKQTLIASGAKIFAELHPSYKSKRNQGSHWQPEKETMKFSYGFQFYGVSDVTEKRRAKYVELFEAAWSGDLDKIKALTLVSWDPENKEPPLQIAVTDLSNSPFSLAYMRGHLDVAKAILEIAQAQYVPKEKPVTRYRMQTSEEEDEEYESDSANEEDEPRIYGQIVDEQFTIDNIGQVSMQVKSRVKPLKMLEWAFPSLRLEDGKHMFSGSGSLLEHVINNDDRKGLKYYHDLTVCFAAQDEDNDDGDNPFVSFPQSAFWSAVEQGRIGILSDMIKWGGAGLPLEALVKKTGVEIKEKPKYYQGLTVYGKKRNDWATAGRNVISRPKDSTESPLLRAAQSGCIESVEWFLGDAPLRNYLEFSDSRAAQHDLRLKHLRKSRGGFEKAVTRWLGTDNDLIISAAVLGPHNGAAKRLVEYLIKAYPSALEAKGTTGMTPLFIASWLGRVDMAKLLIANGADQSTKNTSHDNIIHAALTNDPDPEKLAAFLKLLDPELLAHLLLERSGLNASDGRTPLHRWLVANGRRVSKGADSYVKVLHLLLGHSEGHELSTLDAGGDTPLHTLIRDQADPELIRAILQYNPQLLHRENAVGMTPAEVAHDAFVHACIPQKPHHRYCYEPSDNPLAQVLLNRAPEEFARLAKQHGQPAPKPVPRVREIYDLAAEFAAVHPGKRRLVSLHEANDVARRIGETYQGQRYGWKGRTVHRLRRARRVRADDLPDEEEEEEEGRSDGQAGGVLLGRMNNLRSSAWEDPKQT